MKPPKFTKLQQLFVAAYPKSLNYTQAYIDAGGSAKTAHSAGPRMGEVPHVKAAIDAALAQQVKKFEIQADDVLGELKRIGLCDIGEAFDEHGNLKRLKDIPIDVRRAMSGLEVDELWEGKGEDRAQIGVTRKVKFWDKPKALELLGKYLKLWADRVVHTTDPEASRLTFDELRALAKK